MKTMLKWFALTFFPTFFIVCLVAIGYGLTHPLPPPPGPTSIEREPVEGWPTLNNPLSWDCPDCNNVIGVAGRGMTLYDLQMFVDDHIENCDPNQ